MTARYKSRMFDTEDQAREAFDLLEWAGVHARVVGPIRTEVIHNPTAPRDLSIPWRRVVATVEEWEVNIVLPAQLPDTPRPVPTPEPDEHDVGRSTIWDELEESRD